MNTSTACLHSRQDLCYMRACGVLIVGLSVRRLTSDKSVLWAGDGHAISSPGRKRLRWPPADASGVNLRLLTRAHKVSANREQLPMTAMDGVWGREDAILSASTGVCLRRGVGAAGARNGGDQEARDSWAGIGFGKHAMSRGRAFPNGLCNACEMSSGRQRRFGGMAAATSLAACIGGFLDARCSGR